MACKKSELISAINSFAAARASNDGNLIQFSGQLLGQYVETLEFEPEAEPEENNDDQSEQSS
jgi:hypothetical protein|tara:strand:- start:379 stop:564 length:186 start_codon:yes stop_codon:yes gene_type:complete